MEVAGQFVQIKSDPVRLVSIRRAVNDARELSYFLDQDKFARLDQCFEGRLGDVEIDEFIDLFTRSLATVADALVLDASDTHPSTPEASA